MTINEIFVHALGPSTSRADRHYRALAGAYEAFEATGKVYLGRVYCFGPRKNGLTQYQGTPPTSSKGLETAPRDEILVPRSMTASRDTTIRGERIHGSEDKKRKRPCSRPLFIEDTPLAVAAIESQLLTSSLLSTDKAYESSPCPGDIVAVAASQYNTIPGSIAPPKQDQEEIHIHEPQGGRLDPTVLPEHSFSKERRQSRQEADVQRVSDSIDSTDLKHSNTKTSSTQLLGAKSSPLPEHRYTHQISDPTPPVSSLTDIPQHHESTEQTSESSPFTSTPRHVLPPRPRPSALPVDRASLPLPSAFEQLTTTLPLEEYYTSFAIAARTLMAFERGHWRCDLSLATDSSLVRRTWDFLAKFVGEGQAGWGVTCWIEEGEPGGLQAKGRHGSRLCISSFGAQAGHVYLLLYAASESWVRRWTPVWIDSGGTPVIRMMYTRTMDSTG